MSSLVASNTSSAFSLIISTALRREGRQAHWLARLGDRRGGGHSRGHGRCSSRRIGSSRTPHAPHAACKRRSGQHSRTNTLAAGTCGQQKRNNKRSKFANHQHSRDHVIIYSPQRRHVTDSNKEYSRRQRETCACHQLSSLSDSLHRTDGSATSCHPTAQHTQTHPVVFAS